MNILISTHYSLSETLLEAAEMIIGKQQNVKTLTFMPNDGIEFLKNQMEQLIQDFGGEVLVLTDIPGGSPTNVATALSTKYPLTILTGTNLPMLLELLLQKEGLPMIELIKVAEEAGKSGIKEIQFKK